jgi:uncharacterized membrane protein YjjP (DUF1212 family)
MSKWKNFLKSKNAEMPPEAEQTIPDDKFEQGCQFVARIVTQAHQYGVSYVSLDTFFAQLPHIFGFNGQMLAAPPFLFLEFWRSTDTEPYRLTYRLPSASYNLTKLSGLGALIDDLNSGKASMEQGLSRLNQIDSLPPPYRNATVALGYSLCGAGFAVLLSAAWLDVLFSAVLSLVVFAIAANTRRSQWVANRINLIAALVTSILANLIALLVPGSDPFTVALCAVIVLIPGLSLTLGVAELASKSTITGIERLVDGVLITLVLVVGNALGASLVNALWPVPAPVATPGYSLTVTFSWVILLMLGLALIFQVRRQDIAWVILGGGIAYTGFLLGGQFGNWQGSFVGALMLGLYTGLLTARLRLPSSVVMLPGIMILVPGVAAYFGIGDLQTYSITGALPAVWGVLVQIMAIIGGLYIAASIVPRRVSF